MNTINHGIYLVVVEEGALQFSVEVAGDKEEENEKDEENSQKDENGDH